MWRRWTCWKLENSVHTARGCDWCSTVVWAHWAAPPRHVKYPWPVSHLWNKGGSRQPWVNVPRFRKSVTRIRKMSINLGNSRLRAPQVGIACNNLLYAIPVGFWQPIKPEPLHLNSLPFLPFTVFTLYFLSHRCITPFLSDGTTVYDLEIAAPNQNKSSGLREIITFNICKS